MSSRNTLLNLLGQIRIYSLIDLIIILIAIKADNLQFIGVILLHLGFLLFLEYTHKHKYRRPFPRYLWVLLLLIGIINNTCIRVFIFLKFPAHQTQKTSPKTPKYTEYSN